MNGIALTTPPDRVLIADDTVSFRWRVSQELEKNVRHYDITFWSTARIFRRRIPVQPEPGREEAGWITTSARSAFRKHGRYFWRVTAVDSQGYQTRSGIRSFVIPRPSLSRMLHAWYFPYEIQFGLTRRIRTAEYKAFLNRLTPSTHLEGYGDVGLFFKQPGVLGLPGTLEERFYLMSSVGLGSDWRYQVSIFRNEYMAFSPEIRGGIAWFSTGIQQYSSRRYHVYLGGNCEILPNAYVTLFGGWLPLYRVRYAEKQSGVRTFVGKGWEGGMRFVIPRSMIPVFHIAGIEIDFERIPFVISVGHIRDDYTDVVMKNRCFGVGYLFR